MAENKNMKLDDEMMKNATGGEGGERGSRYRVGDRVNPMNPPEPVQYATVLAVWYDDNCGDYCYACDCVIYTSHYNKTMVFKEGELY